MNELTNEELMALCSSSVEAHESLKNRIAELTIDLENRIKDLEEVELTWVEVMNELTKRNNNVTQQEVPTEN